MNGRAPEVSVELLEQLCTELDLPMPKLNEKKIYPLSIREDVEVEVRLLKPGVSFHSNIKLCPSKKREDLFMQLMRANYLGQLTGDSRIGMSADEKSLTLSLGIPYELNYRTFRDRLEDFVNFLLYWRDEIAKFESQESVI